MARSSIRDQMRSCRAQVLIAAVFLSCGVFAIDEAFVGTADAREPVVGHYHRSGSASQAAQVDPQVGAVIEKMAAAGVLHPATVDEIRKAYLFYPTLSGKPEDVLHVEDRVIPGPGVTIPIRIYTPSGRRGLPLLVFFHGGGFVAGSLDTYDTPLRSVASRCNCIVASVAYRLAPENPYPAGVNDAYAATEWIADHAAEMNSDPRLIAVAGDGAGGNIAALVTLMAKNRGGPRLVFQVLIYPMIDQAITRQSRYISGDPALTPEGRALVLRAYVPLTQNLEDPYISPIFAESLRGLPPALIVTDEDDPSPDEGDAYANQLADDGVQVRVSRYPNMIHGFFLMGGVLDAGQKVIEEIADALKHAFRSAPESAAVRPEQRQ